MRIIVYIAVALLTFFIQGQVFPLLFNGTWEPDLILTLVVILTILKGRKMGIAVAIISGFLQDILISNFFGLHFFPYLVVAYLFSIPKYHVYEEQWYISFGAGVLATIINGIVVITMLYLAREDVAFFTYSWHHVWTAMWGNGILAIILHEILWRTEGKEEYIW